MSYPGDPRDLEPQGKLRCGCWDECTGECEEPEWDPDYDEVPADWPPAADDPQSFGE